MRILLYTATGVRNLGDECILLSEYGFLRGRFPGASIRIATYDRSSHLLPRDPKTAFFSYFPNGFGRKPIRNAVFFLRNIWEILRSDLVIIGGGGLFYDNESGQSFRKQRLEWLLRVAFVRLFRKRLAYWGIGIDVSEKNLPLLRPLFPRNAIVSVRDARSQMLLRSIWIESHVVTDSAFLLLPRPRTHHRTVAKVGLALRSGYLENETENVEKILRFLKAEGYDPILLAHSAHQDAGITNDVESFRPIAEKLSVRLIETIEETYAAYRELDFVVSMRLHAAILACVEHIPFLAISYSAKTDAILSEIGTPFSMRARDFSIERFREMFRSLASDSKNQGFALREKYGKIHAKARLTVTQLFHGL